MPRNKGGAIVRWPRLRAAWDRALGVGLIAGGGVCVMGGYLGVSGTRRLSEQAAYLASGGLGGLFLLGCGATLLVSADLSDLWRQLEITEEAVDRREIELVRGGR